MKNSTSLQSLNFFKTNSRISSHSKKAAVVTIEELEWLWVYGQIFPEEILIQLSEKETKQ